MKIEIKSRLDARIIFAHEAEKNSLRITLQAAVTAKADLRGADLCGAGLRSADLCGADLHGADLRGADLCGADLHGADLCGADLCGAGLRSADLCGADLCGAYLRDADLRDAGLRSANLCGADLRGAYLCGADLRGVDLCGASDCIDAGTPNDWRTVGWLRGGILSVRVGCRDKRLAEGRQYWAGKDNRREVLAALDYVEAIAKLRGWRTS